MRKRDEKRPWRGAGAGGGRTVEDVGRDEVAPAVGVRGSTGVLQRAQPGIEPSPDRP